MITLLVAGTLLAVVAAAVMALYAADLSHSVILYMGMGLGSTVLYFLFSAPDVALTEAVIGAGISGVVFLVALLQTRTGERP